MSIKRREEADVLRCGYEVGYFDKSDIIRWADTQIEECDSPSTTLLDLAMIRTTDPIDVMNLLRSIGSPESSIAIETQLGFLGLLVTTGAISMERAVRGLFWLVHDEGLTEEQQKQIYYLDDGYDLAAQGYSSMDDIERDLLKLVTPYAEQLAGKYPQLIPSMKHASQ